MPEESTSSPLPSAPDPSSEVTTAKARTLRLLVDDYEFHGRLSDFDKAFLRSLADDLEAPDAR